MDPYTMLRCRVYFLPIPCIIIVLRDFNVYLSPSSYLLLLLILLLLLLLILLLLSLVSSPPFLSSFPLLLSSLLLSSFYLSPLLYSPFLNSSNAAVRSPPRDPRFLVWPLLLLSLLSPYSSPSGSKFACISGSRWRSLVRHDESTQSAHPRRAHFC